MTRHPKGAIKGLASTRSCIGGWLAILYALVFVLSAGGLALQITLTRVFALAQWYHFAFMSVSIGLLGFGASGSVLHLLAPKLLFASAPLHRVGEGSGVRGRTERGVAICTLLFAVATVAAYLGANALPLDVYLMGIEPRQWALLLAYFALLALPFLFAGLGTGLALSADPRASNRIYFASLLGSAAGAGASPFLLNGPAPGLAVAAVALVPAASVALWSVPRRSLLLAPALALELALWWAAVSSPELFAVRTSPYKALNQALLYPQARVVWERHNAFSRVDLLESRAFRSAPGLSLAYEGALPSRYALSTDGENLSPVLPYLPGQSDYVRYLPGAAAYRMLAAGTPPTVLILEPGGGLEAVVALEHGANPVTVAIGNPAVADAVRQVEGSYLQDPRVRPIVGGSRGVLASTQERFDLIVMPLAESFHVVGAGSFSISESYLLTVEAMAAAYARLAEGGYLVVNRWLQLPPSEELRAMVLVLEALERSGVESPASRIAALRTFQTATLIVKRGELSQAEIVELRAFAAEMRYDPIYLPGLRPEEANRFNVLPRNDYFDTFARALSPQNRRELLSDYPFDLSPATDDRPFFFHFFRESQLPWILRNLGRTWQPFGGSGYLVMFALLVFALAASAFLILLPLTTVARPPTPTPQPPIPNPQPLTPIFAYFAGLGVAYLFVEMPLMQRMILLLDQPTYSFAAVLFGLLLFSGLGSLAAERLRWSLRAVLGVLVVGALLLAFALPHLLAPFLGQPIAMRMLVMLGALAPMGFLMGMPFPAGIALLGARRPDLVPWAWGINGCSSVVSSILASMIALGSGFSAVLALAAAAYGVAAIAAPAIFSRQHPSWGRR